MLHSLRENTISKSCGTSLDVYSYNLYNQLTGNVIGGVNATYTYNAKGIRTSKTVGTDVTSFILDGGNVIAEVKGTTVTDYVRGINLICTDTDYYLYNAHGDVVSLTSTSGVITKTYDYDAFGNETNQSSIDTNPFRYCGEYYDTETGTYYLRARYYNPTIGRFGTEDPARSGLNWYTYCACNPVLFVDPTGLESWVFYDGSEFSEQAKSELERLKKLYETEVHLIDIRSLEDFLEKWGEMIESDDAIDGVSMLFHGSPYTIYLGTDENNNPQQLTSSINNVTPNGSDGYYVGNLTKASMKSINLMSCNGGHLDLIYANETMQENGFYHNIAVEMLLTQDVKNVYGMDGSLSYTNIFGLYIPRLSFNQDHYKSWTPKRKYLGKRKPAGKIMFWLNDRGDIGYRSVWN